MPSFFDYLIKSTKEYSYRIRTIAPVDDVMLDRIEYILAKYDVVSIDGPKKTIMQSRPLDFANYIAAEVYIIDIVTHIPISSFVLEQELRHALGITDSMIIVRGLNDPNEINYDHRAEDSAADLEAAKNGMRRAPLLSTDQRYSEYEKSILDQPIAGDTYTKRFLKYLAKVAADRIPPIVAHPDRRKMFDYLKGMPIDPEYYKDSDVVKPMAVKPGTKVEEPAYTSPYGNFDDSIKAVSRVYVNKDGEEVIITAKKV